MLYRLTGVTSLVCRITFIYSVESLRFFMITLYKEKRLPVCTFIHCCTYFNQIWHNGRGPPLGGFRQFSASDFLVQVPQFFFENPKGTGLLFENNLS
jgi:hypothetical protein